jgi:hypothetical protein
LLIVNFKKSMFRIPKRRNAWFEIANQVLKDL